MFEKNDADRGYGSQSRFPNMQGYQSWQRLHVRDLVWNLNVNTNSENLAKCWFMLALVAFISILNVTTCLGMDICRLSCLKYNLVNDLIKFQWKTKQTPKLALVCQHSKSFLWTRIYWFKRKLYCSVKFNVMLGNTNRQN